MQKICFGVDAGGTKVAYGLFNSEGMLVDRIQHPTDIKADGPPFRMLSLKMSIFCLIKIGSGLSSSKVWASYAFVYNLDKGFAGA